MCAGTSVPGIKTRVPRCAGIAGDEHQREGGLPLAAEDGAHNAKEPARANRCDELCARAETRRKQRALLRLQVRFGWNDWKPPRRGQRVRIWVAC